MCCAFVCLIAPDSIAPLSDSASHSPSVQPSSAMSQSREVSTSRVHFHVEDDGDALYGGAGATSRSARPAAVQLASIPQTPASAAPSPASAADAPLSGGVNASSDQPEASVKKEESRWQALGQRLSCSCEREQAHPSHSLTLFLARSPFPGWFLLYQLIFYPFIVGLLMGFYYLSVARPPVPLDLTRSIASCVCCSPFCSSPAASSCSSLCAGTPSTLIGRCMCWPSSGLYSLPDSSPESYEDTARERDTRDSSASG